MREHLKWLIPTIALLLIVATVFGVRLYRELTLSVKAEVQQGSTAKEEVPLTPPPSIEESMVAMRLQNVGLNGKPVLGDTGIRGHMERLEAGEISEETLLQYADDLAYLNEYTSANGGPIPTSFWDFSVFTAAGSGSALAAVGPVFPFIFFIYGFWLLKDYRHGETADS